MIVKKIGRPSKASERRAEILAAMTVVIAREGIAATTLAKVAAEAGFHRTLVAHYFGDRRSLIDAFVSQVVAVYGDVQILGDQSTDIESRVGRAFEPGHYAAREDLVVWAELVALAARNEQVREHLRSLWEDRWLPAIEQQLRAARPHAPADKIGEVAYGLACLVESHWYLELQDVATPGRRRQMQNTARLLLASLPSLRTAASLPLLRPCCHRRAEVDHAGAGRRRWAAARRSLGGQPGWQHQIVSRQV